MREEGVWANDQGSIQQTSNSGHGLQPARLLCPWDSPGKNTGVSCHALLQGIPNPGIETASLASPALADGFFTTEPPRKPKFWKYLML